MNTLMTRLACSGAGEAALLAGAWLSLHARLDAARDDERGMTTETVIITAGLAALAVAIVVIIGNRVRKRAQGIP